MTGSFTLGEGREWDFAEISPAYLVHGLHPYPARMHPHIPRRLLAMFGERHAIVADPFCGSGTALVESMLAGMDAVGVDTNPLACLITKAKTTLMAPSDLNDLWDWAQKKIPKSTKSGVLIDESEKVFLNFWFKPKCLKGVLTLREWLTGSDAWHSSAKWMLALCLSRTARKVSNQRPYEFKSYRRSPEVLREHNPDAFATFLGFLSDIIERQKDFHEQIPRPVREGCVSAHVVQADSRFYQLRNCVDIAITSPPYVDSYTTVGYEQFSKIPLLILGEHIPRLQTNHSGDQSSSKRDFDDRNINTLSVTSRVRKASPSRANVLNNYFEDLRRSVVSLSCALKKRGIACVVMGPRTVCGVRVHTPRILTRFAEEQSLRLAGKVRRRIPRKFLPSRNSQTRTINEEEILVFIKR